MDKKDGHMTSSGKNAIARELARPIVRDRMVRVASKILRDGREAEDAAHDAVVLALRAAETFRAEAQVGTWLHRVAVNAALMRSRVRRRTASRAVALESDGERVARAPAAVKDAPQPTAGEQLEAHEASIRLRAAVEDLPRRYRDVVELCVYDEVPTPDVARTLGITPAAVRTRMGRACARLRARLVA